MANRSCVRLCDNGLDVRINGRLLTVGDMTEGGAGREWQVHCAPGGSADLSMTVPAGQVFVLGANRGNSVECRQFGPVPMDDVVGRVRQIWASFGDATYGGNGWGWCRVRTTDTAECLQIHGAVTPG